MAEMDVHAAPFTRTSPIEEKPFMRYRPLGQTGMHVSTLSLGTMMFGPAGNPDPVACTAIVHAAIDAGINLIDTADMYSDGESERIVGEALKGRRDAVILATKGHFPVATDDRNRQGNSRRHLTRAVEDSLHRLQTDWIDLYQVHRPDPYTAIEETLATLADLRTAGKIRAYGCSTFPAHHLVGAWHTARASGVAPFRCEQPSYSLLQRQVERCELPVCERYGMGVLVWSPLAAGWLSGRIRRDTPIARTQHRPSIQARVFDPAREQHQRKLDSVERLAALATTIDRTLPQLAIAFTLSHPAVTSTLLGPRTIGQLTSLLDCAEVALDDATLDCVDAITPPGTGLFPEWTWRSPALADPTLRRRAYQHP
jgi:aryl-alcohol dehydrogenase-like predicted oxidoreductase